MWWSEWSAGNSPSWLWMNREWTCGQIFLVELLSKLHLNSICCYHVPWKSYQAFKGRAKQAWRIAWSKSLAQPSIFSMHVALVVFWSEGNLGRQIVTGRQWADSGSGECCRKYVPNGRIHPNNQRSVKGERESVGWGGAEKINVLLAAQKMFTHFK